MTVLRFPLGAQKNVLPESFEAYSYRVDKSIQNTQKLAQLGISLPVEVSKQFDTNNTTVYDKKAPGSHMFLDGRGHDTYIIDVQAPDRLVVAIEEPTMALNTLLTNAIKLIEKANKNGILMRSNIYDYVLVDGHLKVFGAFLSTNTDKVSKFADHLFLWKSCSLFLDDTKKVEADTFFSQLLKSKPVFKDMPNDKLVSIRDASLHARELSQWSIMKPNKSIGKVVGIASSIIVGIAGLGYFVNKTMNQKSSELVKSDGALKKRVYDLVAIERERHDEKVKIFKKMTTGIQDDETKRMIWKVLNK